MWPPSSPQEPQGQQPPGGPGQPSAGSWQQPNQPYGQQQPPYGQQLPPYGQQQPQQPSYGQQPHDPTRQFPPGQQGPGGPWYPQAGPPKRKPVWPWVVGVATAVVVALVVVFIVVTGDDDKTTPTAGSSSAPASTPPSDAPTSEAPNSSPPATEDPTVTDGKTVTASDGKSRLTVPGDWTELSLLNEAKVQQGNTAKEQYLMVITEAQASFDLQLDGYAKLVIEQMQKRLTNSNVTGPQQLTINGDPALQYELHGTAQGVRITYWVTLVEGAEDFHQILTWTLETRGEEHGPLLRQVTTTFEDLGA
ncbi:hypothetical protein ACFFMN_15920 [Planobispora siamensis]|uniref:Uncharacterized protein n=1 Tax=Planobispora siamensis TaxID=936338 RepID=A0A8J3SKD1_9ACTN|nr:hypothetical protein [Planobispora siamensis]GIH93894.1 hypothetical protein Psi01_45240 [Planobispora siamensis]